MQASMCQTNASPNQDGIEQWVGYLPFSVIMKDPLLTSSLYESKNILDFLNPIYRGQKFYFCSKTYPVGGRKGDGLGLKKLRKDLQKSALQHGGFHLTSNGGGGKRCVFKCACGRTAPASANSHHGRTSSPSYCTTPGVLLCGMIFTIRYDDEERGYYLVGGYGKAEHSHHAPLKPSIYTNVAMPLHHSGTKLATPKLLGPVVIPRETDLQRLQQITTLLKTSAPDQAQEESSGQVEMAIAPEMEEYVFWSKAVRFANKTLGTVPPVPTQQASINVYEELAPITKELFDVYHQNRCTPSELYYMKQWMNEMIISKRAESELLARVTSRSGSVSASASTASGSHLPPRTKRPSIIRVEGEAAVKLSIQ